MKNDKRKCEPKTGCCDTTSSSDNLPKISMSEEVSTGSRDSGQGCCTPNTKPYSKQPQKYPIQRRDFIRTMGMVLGATAVGIPSIGSAQRKSGGVIQVPENKHLNPAWIKSLYKRGEPEVYTGRELVYIGMPVGGVTAGQVYLGGDGKLWLWNIFNEQHNGVVEKTIRHDGQKIRARDGSNYVVPIEPDSPFEQGFSIKTVQNGKETEKQLDYKGFQDITFKGQYPMGFVTYRDEKLPVTIHLEAFSPFIPLDWEQSSYPATVMRYTLHNKSTEKVVCTLTGWMENAVHITTGDPLNTKIRNRFSKNNGNGVLEMDAPVSLASNKSSVNAPEQQRDYGSMALLLRNVDENCKFGLGDGHRDAPGSDANKELVADLNKRSIGELSKTVELAPDEKQTIEFVVSWYFPNLYPKEGRDYSNLFQGRYYKTKYENAAAVANELASKLDVLYQNTALWTKTFYEDSTLPYWFLNRTMANTSTLATETCYRLQDGRFWAWEGVGCCPGTCTHVWHYAQAMGRIFPEMERNLREKTDFKVMDKVTGEIDFRAGVANRDAADGQAGLIMRAYRDHQMSPNNNYLKHNWEDIKLAMGFLISMDGVDGQTNGMIFGEQHNTLDAEWYGNIPVITSLYLSALACAKAMAKEMGDTAAEKKYASILEKGQENIEQLFHEEFGYFVQREDPKHPNAIGIGTGCYIDQVFGQSWAYQVGLGRLFNAGMNKKSLNALWRYNYVPNMGDYRATLPPSLAGRPYALDGEAGLVMCTWPNGGRNSDWEKHWQYGYFNECMSGFEYQAASHMLWEGDDLLEKGLAITRSVHDRYHPSKRNPYNEVECSDHYARAMASYGVYVAACGFEYHGPKGFLAFAPRWNQENFKAAFIAAEGWGTFMQGIKGNTLSTTITLNYGVLNLNKLGLTNPDKSTIKKVKVLFNGKNLNALFEQKEGKVLVILDDIRLKKGDVLNVNMDS